MSIATIGRIRGLVKIRNWRGRARHRPLGIGNRWICDQCMRVWLLVGHGWRMSEFSFERVLLLVSLASRVVIGCGLGGG